MWGLEPDRTLPINKQLADLARAHRVIAMHGHTNMTLGHLSWRDPEGRGFWLKSASIGLEEVTPDDFILVDFDGEVLRGDGRRHGEWPIHAEIYRARDDVDVVTHSHPHHATVFSACNTDLEAVCQEGVMLHGQVSYFRETPGLIRTAALGRDLASALNDKSVVLMKNHGVTCCGPTISAAALACIFIEKACSAQLLAAASSFPWSAPGIADLAENGRARVNLNPVLVDDFWSYFLRRLDHAESGRS